MRTISIMVLVFILLLVFFAPLGGTWDKDPSNSCGPAAVACVVEQISGEDFDNTVERVEMELAPWGRLPEDIPLVGGATFPWGICRAMEKEGIRGRMLMGSCELVPGQKPFIALIREGQGWHYVAVMEVHGEELVTNNGRQAIGEFLGKWKWSSYWRWQTEEILT